MREIRRSTILFLSVIVITIVVFTWFMQRYITRQHDNIEILNVLHQQNMLSQRITKLTLLIQSDILNDTIANSRPDSLTRLLPRWRNNHTWLLEQNAHYYRNQNIKEVCDSLLKLCTPKVESIYLAGVGYLKSPNLTTIQHAVKITDALELPYHALIKQCVDQYEAEQRNILLLLTFLSYARGIIIIAILIAAYFSIVNPLVLSYRDKNSELIDANKSLESKKIEVEKNLNELKRTQHTLKEERLLLKTIIDNIPANIYVKNLKSQKTLVNKSELNFSDGKTERDVLGKDDFELYPEESARISVEEDRLVFGGTPIIGKETLNVKRDGSKTWFITSKVPLYNNDGEIIGLAGISLDISKQKLLEQTIKESETKYRLLSDNSTDIICLHDALNDGAYLYVSPSYESILGYSSNEIIGKTPFSIMWPEDAEKIRRNAHIKSLKGEAVSNIEFRMWKKDGSWLYLESWSKPFLEEDGVVKIFQTSTRDITERKINEERLRQAKQIAEDAFKVKSNFLSVMSHEIRTPLNGVIGLAQLLMQDNPRLNQIERIKLLKFSADNLLNLLNDILDFNKLESGKLSLEKVEFNIEELLSYVIQTFETKASEKSLAIRLSINTSIPKRVLGDPTRINQIVTNLLSNAVKFTEQGEVLVSLKAGQSKDEYCIEVKDSGIGIPDDVQHHIFESFTQADLSTTRKYGGSGLGLSITKQLVELMGGKIHLTSKPGEGSVFSFTVSLPKAESSGNSIKKAKNGFVFSKAYRILVVDDDPVNQLVATQFLQSWSLNVRVASSGREAIEILNVFKFDLVLMDIQMPEMDGFETTKRIKELLSKNNSIPVLAMTAANIEEVEDAALASGVGGFVKKPFHADDFKKTIYEILEKRDSKFIENELYNNSDVEFKTTLLRLIKSNLLEISTVFNSHQLALYGKVLHKSKTSLSYLENSNLNEIVKELDDYVRINKGKEISVESLLRLNAVLESIFNQIESELVGLGNLKG